MAGTMQAIVPAPTFRSPTAVAGESDLLDQNIYSAIVVSNGGSGTQRVFAVASGGAIPGLLGAAGATPNVWQQTYSDLTTNLTKPGELGSAIGEGSVRAIGISFEAAAYTLGTGAPRTFGMTQFEVADCLSKLSFEFQVGQKRQIVGPVSAYPGFGGVGGSISTTGNAATAGIATNGQLGSGRRLKYPIEVARTDTIAGIFTTGNGSTLAFSNVGSSSGNGQPSLIWVNLLTTVAGDVR